MATDKRTQQEIILRYLVDQATQAQVVNANNAIKQSLIDIKKAAEVGGAVGSQELKRLTKAGLTLREELFDIEDVFIDIGSEAPRSLTEIIDRVEDLNLSIAKGAINLHDLSEEFGEVSKRSALAGGAKSQARRVASGVGTLGSRQAEQAIDLGVELLLVIETLPKLKQNLTELAPAASSAATALGPYGVGLAAAVISFGAAVAFVTQGLSDQIDQTKNLVTVQNEFVRDTRTLSEAQAQGVIDQAMLDRDIAIEQRAALDASRRRGIAAKDNQDVVTRGIFEIYDVFAKIPIEEMDDAISALDGTIQISKETIDQYSEGIANNAFQAETAAQAIERQNAAIAEQNASAIDMARFRSEIVRTQQNLEQMSVEQLESRNEAILAEIAILEAEQESIWANSQSTEELVEVMQVYHRQLALLRAEHIAIKDSALELAQVRESEAAAIEKIAESEAQLAAERAQSQREMTTFVQEQLEKRTLLEKRFADDLISISERAADAAVKALKKLEDKLSDLGRDLGRDLEDQQRKAQRKVLKAQIEAQREQVQDFVDHARELQDIRRKADENEIGLRQARDFRGVFNARRQARITLQDQQRAFIREQVDKNKQRQQDIKDRTKEFAEEREDRLRKFAQAISDTRVRFVTEQALARQNTQASIMTRRTQYQQEMSDLQQQGIQFLQLRRQIGQAEVDVIRNVVVNVGSLLSRLQQQSQSFGALGGSSVSNTTTNSTVNNNVDVAFNGGNQGSNSVVSDLYSIFASLAA